MKKIILSLFTLFNSSVFSQNVGINTTGAAPDASALLEIGKGTIGTPDTKGLLIPRVTLSATNNNSPIGSWVNGLIVYNLANAGSFSTNVVANTLYYCDGTQWLRLNGSLNGGWSLTGNALTGGAPPTPNEWIGSSNAYDFVVKTNSISRMYVRSSGVVNISGDCGIGTTLAPSARLEVNQGSATITGVDILCSGNGTGTGTALNILKSGAPTGAFTSYGLQSSVTTTTNSTNIAGYFSASGGATANYAILVPSTGGNVGIGNVAPTEKLHVTGNIRFSGALMPNNSAGTSGQVLTSAGAGSPPTWSNPLTGTSVLLYNNETSVSGFTYANTTAFTYNVVGTFAQVKVEADIENDCSGGASVSVQGWNYKIVYNGVTTRTAQLWCGDKVNNEDWMSGHVSYMGAVANGQTVKIDVINSGTAGTWYVRNFRVYGIY